MDKKYFLPSPEDMRVGYECEVNKSLMPGLAEGWHKIKIESLKEVVDIERWGNSIFRTSYLNKEQIESEKWQVSELKKGITEYYRIEKGINTGHYHLGILWLELEDPMKSNEQGDYPVYLYNGPCPSINEFNFICKLLSI